MCTARPARPRSSCRPRKSAPARCARSHWPRKSAEPATQTPEQPRPPARLPPPGHSGGQRRHFLPVGAEVPGNAKLGHACPPGQGLRTHPVPEFSVLSMCWYPLTPPEPGPKRTLVRYPGLLSAFLPALHQLLQTLPPQDTTRPNPVPLSLEPPATFPNFAHLIFTGLPATSPILTFLEVLPFRVMAPSIPFLVSGGSTPRAPSRDPTHLSSSRPAETFCNSCSSHDRASSLPGAPFPSRLRPGLAARGSSSWRGTGAA